jgi:Na+-transporting NADH:ubiquinone oxidoreductase subunit B
VRDSLDVKRFMALVIVCLLPHLFFGMYNVGYQSLIAVGRAPDFLPACFIGLKVVLPMVIVTYAVGFFWEILFAAVRRHTISEGLFVTCMLFPLTLPPTTPLWQVALGITFGIVIGKEVFGGTGRNFLNPALTGRAFLFFAYPARMSGDAVWIHTGGQAVVDGFTAATPLAVAAAAEPPGPLVETLNGAQYDFWTLFLGRIPGSIGETSTLLCLAGAAVLILMGIASYRTIICGVTGVLATGWLLNLFASPGGSPWLGISPFHHLAMGGIAFGLAYMATDPVSSPDMEPVRWIYGFLIGALTVMIRVFNPAFPEGAMLSILFMNVFAPLLDHFALKVRLRRRIANT